MLRDTCTVAMLTIRRLSEAVRRALRARAVRHGRIMEAEVREILAATVNPNERVKLGTPLGSFGTEARLTDD